MRAPIIGLGIGLAGAWACGRVLETLLYGVTPHDPLVLAGTAVFLLVVCVTGCALPALHASRTDPARAPRDE